VPKPRPKGVGDGEQVNIPAPPGERLSDGVTEKGRSSGCWTSRYKPVGGSGRQIHRFVNAERRCRAIVSALAK
jgi:hypothetical protein